MNSKEQPFSKPEIKATHPDTTEAMRKPGGRDLEDYKEFLGFDEKDLEGKTILDLGSGALEKLARDLKKAGIKADVISLNPDYTLSKYRNIINNQKDWQKKSAAGVGQALPFKNESFDSILALESVTLYEDALHESQAAKAWAREVARVLKPGGEARLGEILGMAGAAKQGAWEEIIRILQDFGLKAGIESFYLKGEPKPRFRLVVNKPKI